MAGCFVCPPGSTGPGTRVRDDVRFAAEDGGGPATLCDEHYAAAYERFGGDQTPSREPDHAPSRAATACVDCGRAGTAVREQEAGPGMLVRVRRCSSCLDDVASWRAQVVRDRRAQNAQRPAVRYGPTGVAHPARPTVGRGTESRSPDGFDALLAAIGA